MKKDEIRDKRIELRLSKTEKENIEELARTLNLPPSTFIRNLVMTSYEDAVLFEKLGLLKGTKKFLDFKEKYLNIIKEIK